MNSKNRSIKRILCLSLISGLAFASVASANMSFSKASKKGGLVGNGGGTVVCRDETHRIKTIQLLDYYESMLHPGMKIDIQNLSGDWKAKANAVIERVRAKSEMRYQLYSKWLEKFESERLLLEGVQFSTVADSGYIGVPIGCAFEQAAIQRRPNFSEDPRYFINSELWNAMDDSQKAGLVLHEIIYREAIGYGHTDSIRARYLTGLYSSEGFGAQTLDQYWKVLDQAHFELVDVKVKDSLKGTIVSQLDTRRLWQASPDERDVPVSIRLEDELLLSLGKCAPNDCNAFESHYQTLNGFNKPASDFQAYRVLLPKDLIAMQVGDTQFINLTMVSSDASNNPLVRSETLEDVQLVLDDKDPNKTYISLTADINKPFSVSEKQGRFASGATSIQLNKKGTGSWQWSRLAAKLIFEKTDQPQEGFFGTQIAISDGTCIIPTATYSENELFGISAQKIVRNGSVQIRCEEQVQVSDSLSNGSAKFFLDDSSDELHYDPNHRGRLSKLPTSQSGWSAGNSQIGCGKTNCLIPTFAPDVSVTSLIVVNESPYLTLMCRSGAPIGDTTVGGGVLCLNMLTVKIGTRIELFPSGATKTFVAGSAGVIEVPSHPSVSVAAGNTVELDSQGNIISIH